MAEVLTELESNLVVLLLGLGFVLILVGVLVQWAFEKPPYSTLTDWWWRGARQLGTAGVISPFLWAVILLLAGTFVGYWWLAPKPDTKWDYLSFAAPSISALVVLAAVASSDDGSHESWYTVMLFEKVGFSAAFFSLMGIPVALFAYVASHNVEGIDLWVCKISAALIWLPLPANVYVRDDRPTVSDKIILVGWTLIALVIDYLIGRVHFSD